MMKRLLLLFILILTAAPTFAMEHLRLATTTSTENSGLLAELLPPFEEANDCKVDVISVGTGKAIKLGETGDVDVILVHARSKEDKFVAAGFGVAMRTGDLSFCTYRGHAHTLARGTSMESVLGELMQRGLLVERRA